MIEQIRQLLHATPFEVFSIQTSNGKEYRVPSADHATVNPRGNRVLVFFDDENHVTLSSLLIMGIVEGTVNPV